MTLKSSKSLKNVDDISIGKEARRTRRLMKSCKNIGKSKKKLFDLRPYQRTHTQISSPGFVLSKKESFESIDSFFLSRI